MTRPGPFLDVLADPRVQLGAGLAALLATASAVRRDRVRPWEARAFRAVNDLPDSWHRPAWVVMQLGAFGAIPAAAVTAWLAGDGELAGRFLCWSASIQTASRTTRRPRRPWRRTRRMPGTAGAFPGSMT